MEINRGDVFYVNRSETIGSEQRSGRPAIIVSNPECNEHSPVVEDVPVQKAHAHSCADRKHWSALYGPL